jgi:hypothetical protein
MTFKEILSKLKNIDVMWDDLIIPEETYDELKQELNEVIQAIKKLT